MSALQAQFDAEQEQLKTISYLSAEEQAKYAERQSISFMCVPACACACTNVCA